MSITHTHVCIKIIHTNMRMCAYTHMYVCAYMYVGGGKTIMLVITGLVINQEQSL